MSSNKAALKAAKAAIDAQDYEQAITQAQVVLASDANNYFAKLFLGRAFDKQGKVEDSAKAYGDATRIKPDDEQAWLGLRVLYEGQGANKVDDLISVSLRLAEIYAAQDDRHKCQVVMDKMMGFVKKNGSKAQVKKAYETQLPTSSVYSYLEGRLPQPSLTYTRLAELTEEEEKEKINKEIGERRTRLGAKKDQVTADVKREVFAKSQLEEYYQQIINWTNDDEVRRLLEERLLQRAYDTLLVLHNDKKGEKRDQVMKLAHDMVIIKHPFALAWDMELEWANVDTIGDMDVNILREFTTFFPDHGLTKTLKGYLGSEITPFAPPVPSAMPADDSDSDDMDGGGVMLMSAEDRLVLMTEGLEGAQNSALAHRLMGEYFNYLEEYESAVETVRIGLKAHEAERRKSGLAMQKTLDAMNTLLGNALIQYQSPKNHPEAKAIFNSILSRRPSHTAALIGVGLVMEEEEAYPEAIDYLSKALQRDPSNTRIGAELAWCKALNGDLEQGLKELQGYLEKMNPKDPKQRDMRAETMYRIGKCQWDIDPTRSSRKDRTRSYAMFLAAIKTNINYAPAYTLLGLFYEDYARDKKRARQCFQKAFDLSGSEVLAAERLARSYADQGDWEIVEIIAQRVVDSGKVRPPPGSKRKGISWPYSALGVVQMNKQEYQQAIVSFLAALRISPDDYHSYIGLGESYHNSGRYNSSLRTFNFAENPSEDIKMKKTGDSWFTRYMLANVNRELMNYDEAVDAYKKVLEERPKEFGVEIALLQTLLERAWRGIETGYFGRAVDSASEAIDVATRIVEYMPNAFNLWKAVAEACSIFSWVQQRATDLPAAKIYALLTKDFDEAKYDEVFDADKIGAKSLELLESKSLSPSEALTASITASILAQKRAIVSCSTDMHAQAVAWYNLGWTEHRAHLVLEQQQPSSSSTKPSKTHKRAVHYLKASTRCFKRAIELEAGNAEFWNSLGVVTTTLNPRVAQHSFIRSLHLNERNVKTWTNLGVLYLLENDAELAHKAFTRAQSTDPEYAHAGIGEGLVALLYGDVKEALLHFTHAFEISDTSTAITKQAFASYSFDQLLQTNDRLSSILELLRPLFALQQFRALEVDNQPYDHLAALYQERTGDNEGAIEILVELCEKAEAEYETTESAASLARFAQAKADLARNGLATKDFDSAITDADMALDLTGEEEDNGGSATDATHPEGQLSSDQRRKLRLSAHLTLGLAHFYLQHHDLSIKAFQSALEESSSSPDVVCLLSQVLWTKGSGTPERTVAKEQLFASIEDHPDHVGTVVLLGVMAVLDEDVEAIEAVKEELERFRVDSSISAADAVRIEKVLRAIVELSSDDDGTAAAGNEVTAEIQASIFLHPWQAEGWSQLAATSANTSYTTQMALKASERSLPPRGNTSAESLALSLSETGVVSDALRGCYVAPWVGGVWEGLVGVVEGGS